MVVADVFSLPYLSITDNSIELQVSRSKLSNAKDNYQFSFNSIFQDDTSQQTIFNGVARSVIDNCLDGYNGTIFAYGQTGSGKTYTMSGGDLWEDRGIIPRVLSYVFQQFKKRSQKYLYELNVSFIQIYNENAYDLLDSRHTDNTNIEQWTKIIFFEDEDANLQMKNLATHLVRTEEEALNLLLMGSYIRKTNATHINQASSRSHCIFTLNVRGRNLVTGSEVYSKIHLVDLAGSQRVSKSHAEGIILTQAKSINLSLTYLQQVIVSLNQKVRSKGKAGHIPYRNSLLTTLLKDSLGGNCKTAMIATLSLDKLNTDQTISTLRFAQRVKLVQNQMNRNQKNVQFSRIQQLERENAMLRRKMQRYETDFVEQDQQEQEKMKIEKFMNGGSELELESLGQAKRYLMKMREVYNGKLGQYVKELTFISQKLMRYDQIVSKKQQRRRVD